MAGWPLLYTAFTRTLLINVADTTKFSSTSPSILKKWGIHTQVGFPKTWK